MSKDKSDIRLSKFLSLVLRHEPEAIGIILDENGWADTETLINKINEHKFSIDLAKLKHIVETNSKKRFAFNDTFDMIRANQGHSIEINLGYLPQKPPKLLYHGTAQSSVTTILETGLHNQGRIHVHLSVDIETALNVGQRHGKPVVFVVLADEMFNNGFEFYPSTNGVWLADNVPVKFLYLR